MDIKDKLTLEDKQVLTNLALECQVLESLLHRSKVIMDAKAKEILARQGLSPQLYGLKFNPSQDMWEAELKDGALIVPNREMRRKVERN